METESLIIKVQSDSVSKATKRLKTFSTTAATATGATAGLATSQTTSAAATTTNATATGRLAKVQAAAATTTKSLATATVGLGAAMKTMLGPLLLALAPLLAIRKLFTSTIGVQNFRAQLKTATGSVEEAALAFDKLEDFASSTPFALEQSLEAFIKLKNLGLDPSERALTSYGNTASAMGKDLNQLIEAVADAATGEFERLKEFGIKSKSEGDRVTFTFRGVKTTVKKEAGEIEEYLTRLGENEFGGAMADRMNTLGGKVSNLGDLWNKLFRTISEMGVGSLIGDTIQIAINALEDLIALLDSGQFEASLKSWTVAYEGWVDDFEAAVNFVGDLWESNNEDMRTDSDFTWEYFENGIKALPEIVRFTVKAISNELLSLGKASLIAGELIYKGIKIGLEASVKSAYEAAKAIGEALMNPFDAFERMVEGGSLVDFTNFSNTFAEGFQEVGKATDDAAKKMANLGIARDKAFKDGLTDLIRTKNEVDELSRASDNLRANYDAEKAARAAARLEKLKRDPKDPDPKDPDPKPKTATGGGGGGGGGGAGATAREPDRLSLDFFYEGNDLEMAELQKHYDERKKLIMENELITEDQKTQLRVSNENSRNDKIKELEAAHNAERLGITADFLGSLSDLGAAFGKKGAAAAKALAITEATINAYQGFSLALADTSVPSTAMRYIMAGTSLATGLANVTRIASVNSSGNYAQGGILGGPSGSGDATTFNGNRGEAIINFEQQRRLLNIANGSSTPGGGSGNITIVNQTSRDFGDVQETTNSAGERQLIIREAVKQTKAAIAREAETGSGVVVPALQRQGLLRRRGQA